MNMAPDAPAPPTRWSPLAIASIVTSVLPLASALAPLLGVGALIGLRGRPHLRGQALAWAGIAVGIAATGLQVAGAWSIARAFNTLAARPEQALRAAWAGDAEGLRGTMTPPGNEATEARIAAWVADLRGRFGEFESVRMSPTAPGSAAPVGEREMRAAYEASFRRADGTVAAVPLAVTFERPTTSEAIDSIRVRRFAFMPGDGTRIVWPDDEPTADGAKQDAAKPGQ
ncbi:MAG: DUF4190 domain-containing protein [Phycisphaerales bacterium]|nr:DUF4190 domain-containing protein [Phycisphaerales bacterium]